MRAACATDLPRLFELLLEMQANSKYAGDVEVDRQVARSLLLQSVARHGGRHQGGTCVFVVERDGVIEGFIIGILDRVYHIGNRLSANDLYLYVTPRAPRGAASRLIDAYVQWALDNPKVADIKLSWTDVMGVDASKIERLFARKEFRRAGGIWERAGR